MAQTENGVGVSRKLSDGTMIWARRDTYAELFTDMKRIFGDENAQKLFDELQQPYNWGAKPVKPNVAPVLPLPTEGRLVAQEQFTSNTPETLLSAEEVEASLKEASQTFQDCPRCGNPKDKWVAPGTSSRTGKPYKGFYACPTRGCPGR